MAQIKFNPKTAMLLALIAIIMLASSAHAQCTDSTDVDNDGIIACEDNCPNDSNPDQLDSDGNGFGDACTCCGFYTGGYPGNTDCSPDGKRTLADITALIDATYINKYPLCCGANGDTNFDSKMGLADITMLIDHVYIGRNEFGPCQ